MPTGMCGGVGGRGGDLAPYPIVRLKRVQNLLLSSAVKHHVNQSSRTQHEEVVQVIYRENYSSPNKRPSGSKSLTAFVFFRFKG
jgi:hypothetical protein